MIARGKIGFGERKDNSLMKPTLQPGQLLAALFDFYHNGRVSPYIRALAGNATTGIYTKAGGNGPVDPKRKMSTLFIAKIVR